MSFILLLLFCFVFPRQDWLHYKKPWLIYIFRIFNLCTCVTHLEWFLAILINRNTFWILNLNFLCFILNPLLFYLICSRHRNFICSNSSFNRSGRIAFNCCRKGSSNSTRWHFWHSDSLSCFISSCVPHSLPFSFFTPLPLLPQQILFSTPIFIWLLSGCHSYLNHLVL